MIEFTKNTCKNLENHKKRSFKINKKMNKIGKLFQNNDRRQYMKKILCTITLLCSFLFVGCNVGKTLTNTPTKQVEIFLNKYQTLDKDVLDDLDKVIAAEEKFTGEQREKYREIMKDSYHKLAYQIKDQKEDGDSATVTDEVEVVNYGKLMSSANVYLEEHP